MPAKDFLHNSAKHSLEKDGWIVTQESFHIKLTPKVEVYIDLAAEKLLAAEKRGQKIAVEVKSFLGVSAISEFHLAVGQVLNYRLALQQVEPDRILYLGIPVDAYNQFFSDSFIQSAIQEYKIRLMVFHPNREEIILWKD
jgi:XisH protein